MICRDEQCLDPKVHEEGTCARRVTGKGRKQRKTLRHSSTAQQRAEWMSQGLKWCSGCRELQPIEDFVIDRTAYDGLHYLCKKAHRAYQNKLKQRQG